jgi:hypothetical protein
MGRHGGRVRVERRSRTRKGGPGGARDGGASCGAGCARHRGASASRCVPSPVDRAACSAETQGRGTAAGVVTRRAMSHPVADVLSRTCGVGRPCGLRPVRGAVLRSPRPPTPPLPTSPTAAPSAPPRPLAPGASRGRYLQRHGHGRAANPQISSSPARRGPARDGRRPLWAPLPPAAPPRPAGAPRVGGVQVLAVRLAGQLDGAADLESAARLVRHHLDHLPAAQPLSRSAPQPGHDTRSQPHGLPAHTPECRVCGGPGPPRGPTLTKTGSPMLTTPASSTFLVSSLSSLLNDR